MAQRTEEPASFTDTSRGRGSIGICHLFSDSEGQGTLQDLISSHIFLTMLLLLPLMP